MSGQRLGDAAKDLSSVDSLLDRIDSQHAAFSSFRSKRHKLFQILEDALKPVEAICHVAAGPGYVAFPPSGAVFSTVMHLIDVSP